MTVRPVAPEDAPLKAPEIVAETLVETPPVPEPPFEAKVVYKGGQGVYFPYPLSDGSRTFVAGKVYAIRNYGDFVRLMSGGNFEEVS